jgi:hypothetical protein
MIYQGTGWDDIEGRSESEREALVAEYGAISTTPGVTPGLPLGLPADAKMAFLRLGVIVVFAAVCTAASFGVLTRTTVQ